MEEFDAIVIGGGPGGSTAGTILSRAGLKTLVLERERFPRFHVGESLIPYGNDTLRAIGVWEKLEQGGFMPKLGAEFVMGNSAGFVRFWFNRNLPAPYGRTFQVERSRFDALLLDHAAASGCIVRQQAKMESVALSEDGVEAAYHHDGQERRARARWVLDASGRDAFLGRQLRLEKTDLGLPKKIATFAHFHGVRRNEGDAAGHITIVRLDRSWVWIIPLDAEKTSVGLVQPLEAFRQSGLKPEESFEKAMLASTELRFRMKNALKVSEYYHASDYTFRHFQAAGPRWLLVGDAAGFIDPIFSSGVMLALRSGQLAAEAVLRAEKKGRALDAAAQNRYTRHVKKMTSVFLHMIRMFYDNRAFEVFMNPHPTLQLPQAVNNLVAGNTNLDWRLGLRVQIFYLLCRLQRHFPIVARMNYREVAAPGPAVAA